VCRGGDLVAAAAGRPINIYHPGLFIGGCVGFLYKYFMFHSYYQAKFNPSKMINNFQLAKMQKQSRSIHQKPYISLIRGVS
jgi:hypothetical protein